MPFRKQKQKISNVITVWLLGAMLIACAASAAITYFVLAGSSKIGAIAFVRQAVVDVSNDVDELADLSIRTFIDQFQSDYIKSARLDDADALTKELHDFYKDLGIEVNVINSDGIIVASSVPEYVGYDMHVGDQASDFFKQLEQSSDVLIEDFEKVSYDTDRTMKYAGRRFNDGSGYLQIGLTDKVYYDELAEHAKLSTTNRHIGVNGYLLVCDDMLTIINSYHNDHTGEKLSDSGITIEQNKEYEYTDMKCTVFSEPAYVNINRIRGVYIIGVYPVKEAVMSVDTTMEVMFQVELIIFGVLFATLIILLRKRIVNNMVKVNSSLTKITEGDLDEKVEVRDTYEFDELSTDINDMVDTLKQYIAEAAAKYDEDLEVAKEIQTSALPNVFPPFPDRPEFELFACMNPAKVVGGDFYDYYMIDDKTLGFLIADVSGKSIPGAMFMMRSKAVIKSLAEAGLPVSEVFTEANVRLCEGNDADMFLTAWMGYLDIDTGLVHVANAGHNPPVLIHEGRADYVDIKPGLMLAGLDATVYKEYEMTLEKGDILYLYTDGVTEAMDPDSKQYGEERLRRILSFGKDVPAPSGANGVAGALCEMVKSDIDGFVRGAEQSDDITMLCIRFFGPPDDNR